MLGCTIPKTKTDFINIKINKIIMASTFRTNESNWHIEYKFRTSCRI